MTDTDVRKALFTPAQMKIIRFCAIECELQRSGERSVFRMVKAWRYAVSEGGRPTEADVVALGRLVEPEVNEGGYRQVGVRVGANVKMEWRVVPDAMKQLFEHGTKLDPGAWFYEYENIHPFRDGNGRTGQILFNWLNGTLSNPMWAPNFWDDPRRVEGQGA